jgi:WD40 repeat protein
MTGKRWTVTPATTLCSVSQSRDFAHVVVGGRDVLKVVRVDGFTEVSNLRTNVKATHDNKTNDVEWGPGPLVVTGGTSGAVLLYDVDVRGSKQIRTWKDHERTVNKVAWHPDGNIFITGAQDGLVKLFDIRAVDTKPDTRDSSQVIHVSQSVFSTARNLHEVRDVQFSPVHTNYFAAAEDTGTVKVWDMRKSVPLRSITAHQGMVFAVDFHPMQADLIATA